MAVLKFLKGKRKKKIMGHEKKQWQLTANSSQKFHGFPHIAWNFQGRGKKTDDITFVACPPNVNLAKIGPCVVYEFFFFEKASLKQKQPVGIVATSLRKRLHITALS